MIKEIAPNVWKLNVDSNVYFLDFKEKVVVDTGPRAYRAVVEEELSKKVYLDKVDRVVFTHLHYDHSGNFDLFPKAKFYASAEEIKGFEENKMNVILDPFLASRFNVVLHPLKDFLGIKVIPSPGHTKGSVCLLYEKEGVLFSGDTLFKNGFGRIDFPFSDPGRMGESLEKIGKIKYKVLAPGHDY